MSLSLPPPPRRNTAGHTTTAPRYPKINPNSLAASDPSFDPSEEDEDFDRALAELLGESHITPQLPSALNAAGHLSYKGYNTARPLSIASVSSLSSGSYSSYGGSRRVSQAYLSPLSPTPSEPSMVSSGSYFSRLSEDEEYSNPAKTEVSGRVLQEQDKALPTSSFPSCDYYSSDRSHSQYLDNSSRLEALKEYIPTEVRCRLNFHLDECWFVHFSPNGEYMASTSLDNSVILWVDYMTLEPKIHNTFRFTRSITHVAWSPDSKYILVNQGMDGNRLLYSPRLNLIEVASGETLLVHEVDVNGIGWLTDSKEFFSSQPDGTMFLWNLKGVITKQFDLGLNIHRSEMIPGQNATIISTKDCKIVVFTFEDEQMRLLTTMETLFSGMAISPDLRFVAIQLIANNNLFRQAQVRILDFQTGALLRTLTAESYVNDQFLIMPAFFGPNYAILCMGSENGKVNYWDIETGEFIMAREEHSQHAGFTAFHPSIPGFMASASDDCHIFLWVTKNLGRELQEEDEKWLDSKRQNVLPINIKKGW